MAKIMNNLKNNPKTGVFLCNCGDNIAGTIDIKKIKKELSRNKDLVVADHLFLCSESGQKLILKTLTDKHIDRVIIASCSPKHHWDIFKRCIQQKLNPYMWDMVNIREQCSWVHSDKDEATKKAMALIQGTIKKIRHHEPIIKKEISINRDVLVIGAGIAGMHASLELADKDFHVYLVEETPSIGGNMTKLGRTFPTDDCSMCTASPIMNEVNQHPNVDLMIQSEVVDFSGRPGEYIATVKTNPRYVNLNKCTACGLCTEKCPTSIVSTYELGLEETKAIHIPFDSCVPEAAFIEADKCLKLTKNTCGICEKICPADAVDFTQKPVKKKIKIGAVVVATGYQQTDLSRTEYNVEHPDVINGLQLERMITPAGPTQGKILCPSNGEEPKTVTFIQCAGSRDQRHHEYCSNICCMYSAKNAKITRAKIPDAQINMCYLDMRAPGRRYEEYYRLFRQNNIKMIMGKPSEILEKADGKLYVDIFDKATNKLLQINSDLIVLATALEPSPGTKKMISLLNLPYGLDNFISPLHVKIAPVDTTVEGIYVVGTAEAPKSIQDCITDASSAASRVATLLKSPTSIIDLTTATINMDKCVKCGKCIEECNYAAITNDYEILDIACRGCGKCVAVCPHEAIEIRHLTNKQLRSQVEGILSIDQDSIIAYTSETCGYNTADIAGVSRLEYPPVVKIVKVPCVGRLSVNDLIYPFEKGAKAVMVIACPKGLCHYIDGTESAEKVILEAKEIMNKKGFQSEKLRLIPIVSPDGPKFQSICKEEAKKMRGD
jgi:heterodisulfide reductase subunit A2